jgi:hypothetical protein
VTETLPLFPEKTSKVAEAATEGQETPEKPRPVPEAEEVPEAAPEPPEPDPEPDRDIDPPTVRLPWRAAP